ncbi:MAG: 4Fe-4S dicluster domain-containing protein [candidate division WOR-3 bacterium]
MLAEARELLVNDLDSEFKHRLAEKYGDTGFMHCLSCGSCSASCPVRRLEEKYNPRRIIRMAIMGMKDEVYRSEFVWMCSYHTTCLHRCPQGVNIGEVADAVSRLAEEARKSRLLSTKSRVLQSDLDRTFKKQVRRMAESVTACFVCGSCSAVCPETLFDPEKDPRRFIRRVNLGLRDEALADEFKDICATHFRCISRCPQGVQISQIMNAIKQCAIEDGYSYPATLAALEHADQTKSDGRS